MTCETFTKYNAISSMLSGKKIRDYLACGGTLEQLNKIKKDWDTWTEAIDKHLECGGTTAELYLVKKAQDNWADATAEFEAERREQEAHRAETINLFTNHPY